MNNIIVVSDQVWLSPTTQEEELAFFDPIPSTAEKLLFAKEMKKKKVSRKVHSHMSIRNRYTVAIKKKIKIPQVYK